MEFHQDHVLLRPLAASGQRSPGGTGSKACGLFEPPNVNAARLGYGVEFNSPNGNQYMCLPANGELGIGQKLQLWVYVTPARGRPLSVNVSIFVIYSYVSLTLI